MTMFVQYIISVILLFPIIPFFITFIIFKKRKGKMKSFSLAADITTFFLLFSIPLMIKGIWKMNFSWILFVVLIAMGMILTFIDWSKKKEIEIIPLLKKIWRVYFIFLSFLFILIWIIGLILSIIDFVY